MAPIATVVIPTRDRPERLAECLEHLARQDYPRDRFEVIVVDDGSRTPLDGVVAPYSGRLAVSLQAGPSGGPAQARNRGAGRAAGRFLAFLDDDCRPDPGWLEALIGRLGAAPACVVGGRVVNGLLSNPWSSASQLLCDYLYRYYNPEPEAARFFTSNNIAISAEQFATVGGFDPSYPLAAGEDRDLCDRLLAAGVRLVFEPRAVVVHAHALDATGFVRQHFRYGRGARHFHRTRARRAGGAVRVEPLRFYAGLLAAPFSSEHRTRALALSGLLALSQLANATGFLWEVSRPSAGQVSASARR